jgi:Zn ribbon nucleic-acid-binding protein
MAKTYETGQKCPKCGASMKSIAVKIQDADSPVKSYQCGKCGHFDFEARSIRKAISEISAKETALTIRQKVIRLSQGRLGMYLNRDVARSLNLKGGEEVYISVPDKKHFIVSVGD